MSSIDQTLERIATALEVIAANMNPTVECPVLEDVKMPKETPEPVKLEDLREQIKRVSAEGHKDLVRDIIHGMGYQRLVDVPEQMFAALSARIEAQVGAAEREKNDA